jgi:hypothetical protein
MLLIVGDALGGDVRGAAGGEEIHQMFDANLGRLKRAPAVADVVPPKARHQILERDTLWQCLDQRRREMASGKFVGPKQEGLRGTRDRPDRTIHDITAPN